MPIYTEKIKDEKTGKMIDKLVDGKKQYFIKTYVVDENGKSKQITRHNKNWLGRTGEKEANRVESVLRNEYIFTTNDSQKPKTITLNEGMELYLNFNKEKVDDDTLDAKRIKLSHFCTIDETKQVDTYPDKNVTSFNKEQYFKWQSQMRKKKYKKSKDGTKEYSFSIKYLNAIHNEVCSMIDFLINEGICHINFAKQVGKFGTSKEIKMSKVTKTYNVINFEEYQKLMLVSKDDLKYNTYFHLSFTRGPRSGEVRAFRIKDYNAKTKQLMVNHTMSRKNILKEPKTASSKAPIDLDDELNNKINLLIEDLKRQNGFNENWYLFGGKSPISCHALENARDKYFDLANITQYLRLHDFRHSCATWLFSIGIPITVISKILRHSDIKETMKTYTHLFKDDYVKNLNTINKFIKQG